MTTNTRLPLFLLHGALYTAEEFTPLREELSDDFTIYAPNFSGHGGDSDPDGPFSIRLFANDVIEFMEREGFGQIDVFGFSMGGYVGLYLARHYPEKIGRVITLGTKLRWDVETAERETKFLVPEAIEAKVPHFAATLKRRHGEEQWRIVLEKTAEMMENLGRAEELSLDDLAGIDHKVRISLGDRDQMVTIDETIDAYRSLRNGELWVLPGTGHPLEKAPVKLIADGVRAFLKR